MSDDILKKILEAEKDVANLKKMAEKASLLDEKLNAKFLENKKAFEKYMPHILSDFKDFEFDQNLFFISDSGDLNVIIPSENVPVYGGSPLIESIHQVDHFINNPVFSRISFNVEENPRNQIQTEFSNKAVILCKEMNVNLRKLATVPEHVPNLLVLGVGLGYHLNELFNRVSSNHYFIYEPEPLLFFASLCVFDWAILFERVNEAEATLNINVGSDPIQYPRDYLSQIDLNGRYSASKTFLYLHYKSKKLDTVISELHENFNKQVSGWGFFDDGMFSIGHGYSNILNKTPILKNKSKIDKEIFEKIQNIPVFILGNGPSLDDSIDIIKEYKDKAILISCGSTISTLYRCGIKPDIQVDVERLRKTADKFKYFPKDYLADILGLSVNVMHPDFFKYFRKSGYGLKSGEAITAAFQEKIDNIKQYHALQACNPFVGNLGLSYAYYFGFKNIYLMGIDAGYIKGGLHHSKDSIYYAEGADKISIIKRISEQSGVYVDGNFGGKVFSSHLMDYSRYMINVLMKEVKKKKHTYCYNCSNGAFFENTIPLKPKDVFLSEKDIDKNIVTDFLFSSFFDSPIINAEEIDIIDYNGFVEVVEKLKKIIDIEYKSRKSFSIVTKKQADFINSFRGHGKKKSNIYYLLMGSMNTMSTLLLTAIYDYEDEAKVIEYGEKIIFLWKGYLDSMIERYSNVIGWHDEYDWEGIEIFKQQ